MPMQPRPIAETSGPLLPRRRLPTWNIPFSFLGAEPPPRLFDIKWDCDAPVTRCCARNDRQFGTADPECLGDEPDHRFVGGAVGGCLGDPHLELLASIGAPPPTADAWLRRPGSHSKHEDVAQSIAT